MIALGTSSTDSKSAEASYEALWALDRPVYAVRNGDRIALTDSPGTQTIVASAPAVPVESLGARSFREAHGVRAAYVAGAMATGIGSVALVTAMGKARLLAGFGAGGLDLPVVEGAIREIQSQLGPDGVYKVNLLHNPVSPAVEMATAEMFLERGVRRISASGFMSVTPAVALYRARGLYLLPDGRIERRNQVLAKISRPAVAEEFMRPARAELLHRLVSEGKLDEAQARLAERVPIAEDVTAEGDSGGHTDRQPSLVLLSAIAELRDRIAEELRYPVPIRVGSAGGISTPATVLAAFVAGADYVLTGSINQACVEAGTSDLVKQILSEVDIGGVEMAPAADMFELGVRVQVLKQGTLFAARAEKLHRLYLSHESIEQISEPERARLEKEIFQRPVADVWAECQTYLAARAPKMLAEGLASPKRKMALIFRWYLGMTSRWAIEGRPDRRVDFQVWCGPAMAAFNRWAKGTSLEHPRSRTAVGVADRLLEGAAAMYRARLLALQGATLPPRAFTPVEPSARAAAVAPVRVAAPRPVQKPVVPEDARKKGPFMSAQPVSFLGSVLKAVASTPNQGDDDAAYAREVVEASKRWRRQWEEGVELSIQEKRDVLAQLRRIFEVKRVDPIEQRERLLEIARLHDPSGALGVEETGG